MKKRYLAISCIAAGLAILAMPGQTNAQTFDFNNGTDFDDGQTVDATTMAGDVTLSIVDLFAPDFVNAGNVLRASAGDDVVTQIGSNSLGVDNPSVDDATFGGGMENRDLNDGEGIVLEFDAPVIFTELDFQSLDDGTAIVTIEGVGTFEFVEDDVANPGDIFSLPFGIVVIPAGADITFSLSSPDNAEGTVRIGQFTVTSPAALTQPVLDFNNDTEFDNGGGIGTIATATSLDGSNTVMATILDVFAPDFLNPGAELRASSGGAVATQIGSNSLGVDNPSVTDDDFFAGAGIEERDFNDGEGLVIEFDVPVVVTALNLVSLDVGTLTVAIEGVGTFDFVDDPVNAPDDNFSNPFGVDFIPAGADITFSFSSPPVAGSDPPAESANVRITDIVLSTSAVSSGDFNGDGVVDCDDLDSYVGNLGSAATGALANLDLDGNGTVQLADANFHITTLVETSNGVVGTFPGDLNCDGEVNVLGDAFILIGSLGDDVTSYSDGDINFDGEVNVLGDAFILIGNLGMTNN